MTTALIPRTISCAGIQFQAVQLADGRLAVTLSAGHQPLSAVLAQAGEIIDARFEALEGAQASLLHFLMELVSSLPADMIAPSGILSPMRLTHLYVLARRVRQSYGVPVAETLILLAEHFQVEDISDLPATAWPAVLDWFKVYLLSGYPPKA